MDIVWLKKDIRIHDHGPLAEISRSTNNNKNPFCILYLFEPDQLSEPCVHGSHICFINEGLVDLDRTLCSMKANENGNANGKAKGGPDKVTSTTATTNDATNDASVANGSCIDDNGDGEANDDDSIYNYTFKAITVCHANAVYTFNSIHKNPNTKIRRILCHQETGHYKSFIRDRAVRKWCKKNSVQIVEYNQSGVTRCLKDRDDFAKKLNFFLLQPCYDHDQDVGLHLQEHRHGHEHGHEHNNTRYHHVIKKACNINLVTPIHLNDLHGRTNHPLKPSNIPEIPKEHQNDRIKRQKGGETIALQTLQSFLSSRGSYYANGISSPNTSWNSGSRLSPYLTWGHISLRFVLHKTREKQCYLRQEKKNKTKTLNSKSNKSNNNNNSSSNNNKIEAKKEQPEQGSYWLKSLQAFSSRMHWRSHFIQKLEAEPTIEKKDLCTAYQHLRRQPNDWNESYYLSWSTGTTGFPFVDACMRCLLTHGWLNFRMRAMLVSFATYNLWLDWKRIAPHLARIFLDYEPGIHYPQLQMQSGTTGINAMRVYNVTKQGRDQDPKGIFIRRYVPELKHVPLEYIHEPNKMSRALQDKIHVCIGTKVEGGSCCTDSDSGIASAFKKEQSYLSYYPKPIVNEQQSAKIAKEKVAAVRKQESTKRLADQVYIKHGSRNNRDREMNNNNKSTKIISPSSSAKKVKVDKSQKSIKELFGKSSSNVSSLKSKSIVDSKKQTTTDLLASSSTNATLEQSSSTNNDTTQSNDNKKKGWNCSACTYLNEKPLSLACSMCGTLKRAC